MRECSDCGATNMQVLGFACDHDRYPMGSDELKRENDQLRNLLRAVREENQRLRVRLAEAEKPSEKSTQTSDVNADIESRARRIAARKMGLQKDFYGRNLPDDLWKQAIPDARREADEDAKFRYANRMQI